MNVVAFTKNHDACVQLYSWHSASRNCENKSHVLWKFIPWRQQPGIGRPLTSIRLWLRWHQGQGDTKWSCQTIVGDFAWCISAKADWAVHYGFYPDHKRTNADCVCLTHVHSGSGREACWGPGLDSPAGSASLSDDNIVSICNMIRRPHGLVSIKMPYGEN